MAQDPLDRADGDATGRRTAAGRRPESALDGCSRAVARARHLPRRQRHGNWSNTAQARSRLASLRRPSSLVAVLGPRRLPGPPGIGGTVARLAAGLAARA